MRVVTLHNKQAVAGLLLFVAGVVALMGIITAEAYYPTIYSTATNEISDLGSTRPPNPVIYQPSATIFNVTMIVVGLLVLTAVNCLRIVKTRKLFIVPLALFGLGILGVGLFPGNTTPHPYFALLTFTAGGISAILSAKIVTGPFKYASIALGAVALVALFFAGVFIPHLGDGGTERWIAYPITMWLTGLGGYYLGRYSGNNPEV
jgi:hypothetical membrane protein